MRLNWGTAPVGAFQIFELLVVVAAIVFAFTRPGLAQHALAGIEDRISKMVRRPWLCGLLLFLFPIAVRALLVPVYASPLPFISDEYAYLLQADTFASGRLTNPSPAFPERFNSVYVLSRPTYNAEYQPAQGLVLALGQVATRNPWAGVVLSMAVLCPVTFWALLAWLPAVWAFVGTALIVDIELAVLSYWTNSYWGGAVPALGGALLLGALLRLRDRNRFRNGLVCALGLFVLLNSRPLEGVFLALVLAGALGYWTFFSREIELGNLMKQIVPAFALGALFTVVFAAYYNQRVTGSATVFPYLRYRTDYGLPQGFFWQKPVLAKAVMPSDIQSEYEDQLHQHARRNSIKGVISATGGKLRRFWEFYVGVPLTATLFFLPFIWRRAGMKLALWGLVAVLVIDNLLFFAYFPHYSAAVLVLIVLVLTQCLRQMRSSGPAGLFLSRALPLVCLIGLVVPIAGRLSERYLPVSWRKLWQSEFAHDVSRENFTPQLAVAPGRQLVLVHYLPYDGRRKTEWIFNKADIEHEKIIWVRDSDDPAANRRLLAHFAGRTVWLAEPDAIPPSIRPLNGGLSGSQP